MNQPICFLTMDSLEGFFTYDTLASRVLEERGWRVEYVSWRKEEDWRRFAAVIIRSPWDYQKEPEAFLRALEGIEASGVMLLNPLPVVRWNLVKTYLLELEAGGVRIIPTVHGRDLQRGDVARLAGRLGTDEIVLKPTIGANADGAFRMRAPFGGEDEAVAHYAGREYLAQPFFRSIVEEGEVSLFYFLGEFSHAVRKRPKAGDFRVQEEHGGVISPMEPTRELHEAGGRAMAALPHELLYARVDVARCADGEWGLMEVELIEPSLYFDQDAESAGRFADAVIRVVESRGRSS